MSEARLKIGFLLGSPDINGGTYVIYEHGSRLVDLGYEVYMLTREQVSAQRYSWHPGADKLGWLTIAEAEGVSFDLLFATGLSPRMDNAARPIFLLELRILEVVFVFRLFLGIQVIKIAKKLVEAVVGGQVFIAIAEVVLAELTGGIPLVLQKHRYRGVEGCNALLGAGQSDF